MSGHASIASEHVRLWRGVTIGRTIKFLVCLFVLSIPMEVLWGTQFNGVLYNCTDDIGFDYFMPGDWVHGAVVSVPQVSRDINMSHPDTVKAGWGIPQLWLLWSACFAVTVVLSLWISRPRWLYFIPLKSTS